jgi:alcohol dehydrogenase class IV
MSGFRFYLPTEIYFDADVLSRIGRVVEPIGTRAVIVSESPIREAGFLGQVHSSISESGGECLIFDEIEPGSGSDVAEHLSGVIRGSYAQVVVAIGGSKVLAIARAATAAAAARTSVYQLFETPQAPARSNRIPIVAVPAAGRDFSLFRSRVFLKDLGEQRMRPVEVPSNAVRAAIFDPRLYTGLSQKYIIAIAMDILLAAIEGYVSGRATVLSDTLFIRAVTNLRLGLLGILRGSKETRPKEQIVEAGALVTMGLALSSRGAAGALSLTLNGRFGIPKSWTSTVLLPHILDFYATANAEKLQNIARALGEQVADESQDAASRASAVVRRLLAQSGLPTRLRDLGLNIDEIGVATEDAARLEMVHTTPFPISAQELFDILKRAN